MTISGAGAIGIKTCTKMYKQQERPGSRSAWRSVAQVRSGSKKISIEKRRRDRDLEAHGDQWRRSDLDLRSHSSIERRSDQDLERESYDMAR